MSENQEATPMKAGKILSATRVYNQDDPSWNVYHIGCSSPRSAPVNFASQQMRAFKLVWALDKSKLIYNKKIAVVGAGLSGITAGITCLYQGAKEVALYDKTHELMAFQHGSFHRYVHPNIFQWPDDKANTGNTEKDFPFLNWKENNADEIRQAIITQVTTLLYKCYQERDKDKDINSKDKNVYSKVYRHRLGCHVRRITKYTQQPQQILLLAEGLDLEFSKERKEFVPNGGFQNYQELYDVVIIAVGAGLESKFSDVPFRSYWHLDTLSQPTISGNFPKRWLVSGTGDGGLIDAIRLRLFDTDQKKLTNILLGNEEGKNILKEALLGEIINKSELDQNQVEKNRLEREIFQQHFRDNVRDFEQTINFWDSTKMYALRQAIKELKVMSGEDIEVKFREICEAENHQPTVKVIEKFLKAYERTDTIVYLHGRHPTPYGSNSQLFHQFLIYLLMRYCGLRYIWGELESINKDQHTYRVEISRKAKTSDSTDELKLSRVQIQDYSLEIALKLEAKRQKSAKQILDFDEVVIRHGTDSFLAELFDSEVAQKSRENEDRKKFEKNLWHKLNQEWVEKLKFESPRRPSTD